MKINILDAHDRLLDFNKQADYISQGCQDCIRNRPIEFGSIPFYIFAHKREIGLDERISLYNQDLQESLGSVKYQRQFITISQVPTHRLIWAPRLTKPSAQENSMLFKSYPLTDHIKIVWIIPEKHLWKQYEKNNLTEHKIVVESIHEFRNNPRKLEVSDDDDLSEERVNAIYKEISDNQSYRKLMDRLYL